MISGSGARAEIHGGFKGLAGGAGASIDPDSPDGKFRLTILHGGPAAAGTASKWHVLVIDSNAPNPMVPASYDLPNKVVIDGFAITGGNAFATTVFDPVQSNHGAGVYVSNVGSGRDILLENLILQDNNAGGTGGGMYLANSSVSFGSLGSQYVRVRHCRFLSNSAQYGAGLGLSGGVVISNCKFSENGSLLFGGPANAQVRTEEGGGIWMSFESRIDAANLLIVSNAALMGGATFYTPPAAGDSVVTYNVWRNCTFADNRCAKTFPMNCFGGIVIEGGGSSPAVPTAAEHLVSYDNCIMWGNSGADLAYIPTGGGSGPHLLVEYCDVGVAALGYNAASVLNNGYDPAVNNLSVDPVFEDPVSGNYRLNYELNFPWNTSPCIDAGSNSRRGADLADLNDDGVTVSGAMLDFDYRLVDFMRLPNIPGHPRVVNVATPNAPAFGEDIDMGAFERDSAVSEVQ